MNRFDRAAILTELADQLRAQGSWTGETHIQKATYVLQEMLGVDLALEFVLYKHGPFSFDLRDELTSIRADGLLVQEPHAPYGPTLKPTESSVRLRAERSDLIESNRPAIKFVAERLGGKGIFALEQLSTALLVRRQDKTLSAEKAAKELHQLKPHVTMDEAALAVAELDELMAASVGIGKVATPTS